MEAPVQAMEVAEVLKDMCVLNTDQSARTTSFKYSGAIVWQVPLLLARKARTTGLLSLTRRLPRRLPRQRRERRARARGKGRRARAARAKVAKAARRRAKAVERVV